MLPQHQFGIVNGILALSLMIPAAVTSNDRFQQALGKYWRKIHLLTVPALILAVIHTILSGSHYLGELQLTWNNQLLTIILSVLSILLLLVRSRLFNSKQ